jgi:hypothetical protein
MTPALIAFALAIAQDDGNVLDAREGPPSKMLYACLQAEAKKRLDARRAAVEAMGPEATRRRQGEVRSSLLSCLGDLPGKTPLNPRVAGRIDAAGCTIERVVYESRPDHHVAALLYLPRGRPPFPGVLVPCGHAQNAKAFPEYQRVCLLLARNGIAALCFDPLGQGERVQLFGADGSPAVRDNSLEHTMIGIGALLVGRSGAGYAAWDSIRGLDYLAGRPEIDPRRLGVTGNSGGGAMTGHVMALDDRVVAAAPDCSVTNLGLERLLATFGPC